MAAWDYLGPHSSSALQSQNELKNILSLLCASAHSSVKWGLTVLHRYLWRSDAQVNVNYFRTLPDSVMKRAGHSLCLFWTKCSNLGLIGNEICGGPRRKSGKGEARSAWGPGEGPGRVWHSGVDMLSPPWSWYIPKSLLLLFPAKADLVARDPLGAACLRTVHAHGDEGTWDAFQTFLWFQDLCI